LGREEDLKFHLAGDFLFDFDKDIIKPEAKEALEKAGNLIRSTPGKVEVNGYTDSIGDGFGNGASNRALSRRRATSVAHWLINGNYVTADRVEIYGGGSEDPIVDNKDQQDTPANRRRQAPNRRVTVVVHKQ
jgi:outer membrane protein OmpA-like peptidoglycan-associated protein